MGGGARENRGNQGAAVGVGARQRGLSDEGCRRHGGAPAGEKVSPRRESRKWWRRSACDKQRDVRAARPRGATREAERLAPRG